jgi:DNA-binding MarR family transcriptional regulator
VELVRLYSNQMPNADQLDAVRMAALGASRRIDALTSRQRQHRLDQTEAALLVAAYAEQKSIKDLAKKFEVHRTTVARVLRRAGVKRTRSADS